MIYQHCDIMMTSKYKFWIFNHPMIYQHCGVMMMSKYKVRIMAIRHALAFSCGDILNFMSKIIKLQSWFSYICMLRTWAFQSKMKFSPDFNKWSYFFLEKQKNSSHHPVAFNDNDIKKYPHHKHLNVVLDLKLDYKFHVDQKIKKCNKSIGLIRWLSVSIPGKTLLTIYKSFIRPRIRLLWYFIW